MGFAPRDHFFQLGLHICETLSLPHLFLQRLSLVILVCLLLRGYVLCSPKDRVMGLEMWHQHIAISILYIMQKYRLYNIFHTSVTVLKRLRNGFRSMSGTIPEKKRKKQDVSDVV